MIAIYDKTEVSPITGSSEGYTAYKRIPTRPSITRCDVIDECPECAVDIAFKYPVDVSDTLYYQFHQADNYNTNPLIPEYGWFDGLTPDHFISAYLEFADGTTQVVTSSGQPDIWVSGNVGWNNGSYQTLILSAEGIRQFMTDEDKGNCFRIKIVACRILPVTVTEVVWIKVTLPSAAGYDEGDLAVNSGALFVVESGAWVFERNLTIGEVLLLTTNGQYYEWDGATLEKTVRPEGDVECDSICYTAWHKFINCEMTVVINGIFGVEDCQGNYYGVSSTDALNGILPYQDKYRIEASFEMQRIFEEKEVNENDIVTSFVQKEEWLLRNIKPLPEEVVRRLSNSMIATRLYIDSNEYKNPSERQKLNESGKYWYLGVTMERDLCEKTSDCDTEFVFNPIVNCHECVDTECTDATVENSDGSYSDMVAAGDTLVLPDINVTNQNGVVSTWPSVKNLSLPDYRSGIVYSRLGYRYDQYTSYASGDAGDNLQDGLYNYTPATYPLSYAMLDNSQGVLKYNVLRFNNVNGNTNRFTAEGANTTIDELTGLQWYHGSIYTASSWSDALNYLIATVNAGAGTEGYTDWRMPTIEEFNDIMRNETSLGISYVIPGFNTTFLYWTGNTVPGSTTFAYRITGSFGINSALKTSGSTRLALVRTKRS